MNLKSITAKAWLFTAVFAVILLIQFVIQYTAERQLANELEIVSTVQLKRLYKTYTLHDSTVQVQQWLTDISATRARDGLNDGMDVAKTYYESFNKAVSELATLDKERASEYESLLPVFERYYQTGRKMAQLYVSEGPDGGNTMMSDFDATASKINGLVDKLLLNEKASLRSHLEFEAKGADASVTNLIIFSFLYAILLMILILGNRIILSRPLNVLALLIKNMSEQQRQTGTVKVDTNTLSVDKQTEIGAIGYWLNDLLGNLGKMYEEQAEKNRQIEVYQVVVEKCDTNVMLTDNDCNIVYINEAANKMTANAEADIRKDLPNFDARSLVGQNIDVFHKNPSHQRGVIENLRETFHSSIKVGGRTFGLILTPIFSKEQNERLGTLAEWTDQTERLVQEQEDRRIADENYSIRLALDVCNTNVMMADNDLHINYMNKAVLNMMRIAESDLKAELPNFNANDLMGQNIDVFHKKPSHQRNVLANLKDVYRTEIKVGVRTFSLAATPIFNAAKERLGTVVEWGDRTIEVAVEKEVDTLVVAANEGDLSQRIPLEGKTGFFKGMSEGLNSLMDVSENFFSDIGRVLGSMAEGDLTQRITNDYQGEFDRVKQNAIQSSLKLSDVLSKIQNAASSVGTSADEVAQGSDDLSRRTESQASSLEETASSMEEITATVKQTAENAAQSTILAADAKKKAEDGGEVVRGAVSAMADILDSSNKINDIIGVIDEIAFQTNLLALNAAVEAARAGEQGRGFAVVAGEVRTLSQRSAAAAKEIKDLIRDSVNKVESGSVLVNQSGEMLRDIVSAVDNVVVVINDVSTAAAEQENGIVQINQAITGLDEMTQQNAALVEESTAASRSMTEEARGMNSMIGFFKISGGQTMSGGQMSSGSQANASQPSYASSASSSPSSPPIMTYQGGESKTKKSGGAASFSESDDWEDF